MIQSEALAGMLHLYAWLGAWLAHAALLGAALLRWVPPPGPNLPRFPNAGLALFFTAAVGLALHMLLLTGLALGDVLAPKPVLISAGLSALLAGAALAWRGGPGSPWLPPWTRRDVAEWLPLLALAAAFATRPLLPPHAHDELSYHLPYARFYMEQGGLVVNEYLRYPYHAHGYNLLFAVALMAEGESLAHGIHALAGLLLLTGTYALGKHWFGWGGGLLAAGLLALTPDWSRWLGSAHVDLGHALFVCAAAFWLAVRMPRGSALPWPAALFLGAAMSVKYLGLLFTVPIGLWVGLRSRSLRTFVAFAALTTLLGGFWYLRAWLLSGNPVHPFAADVFGITIWTEDDLRRQVDELARHGVTPSIARLFELPWRAWQSPLSYGFGVGGALTLGLFYLCPLGWKRMPPGLRAMFLIALAWLVFWFYTAQVIRYLLPVLPLMALCGAALLFGGRERQPGGARRVLPWPALAASVLILAILAGKTLKRELNELPVGEQQHRAWLDENQHGHALMRAARSHPEIGAGPLLQVRFADATWWFDGDVRGDWFGPYGWFLLADVRPGEHWKLVAPERVHAFMGEHGLRGIAVRYDESGTFVPRDEAAWAEWFEEVYRDRSGALFIPREPPGR